MLFSNKYFFMQNKVESVNSFISKFFLYPVDNNGKRDDSKFSYFHFYTKPVISDFMSACVTDPNS